MLRTIAAFDRIGEENAFAVLARANALAAQGRDIINLGIGQPDFKTPEHIAEIRAHVEKYPPRQVPKVERRMRLSGLEPFVHG